MTEASKNVGLLLLPITGILLLILGIHLRRQLKAKADKCLSTQGTIAMSRMRPPPGEDEKPVLQLVVDYSVDGQRYSLEDMSFYGGTKQEGSVVNVMYDPKAPYKAYIAEDYFLVPTCVIIIGSAVTFLGSLFCFFLWSSQS